MKKIFVGTLGLLLLSQTANAAQPSLGEDYLSFKNWLNKEYNLDYSLTYSVLGQRTSPSGRNNAVQSYLYPSITWTTFENEYGTGVLNFAYNSIYYGGHSAEDIQNRSGLVSPINDFNAYEQSFAGLYYTYQFPKQYNWLTLGAGQYNLFMFDGTDYDGNQQVNFLNFSLSQNGSATYSSAGLGAYLQATPDDWSFTAGFQDATNIEAPSIRVNRLKKKHFTTFGQIGYNPTIKGLGAGQYSIMLYNQPAVKEQSQTTNGWSINIQQSLNKKWALFARLNGVSGHVISTNQTYAAGMVYNNPLDRNELDQIGLAYAYNKIDEKAVGSKTYHKAEQIVEAYWAWGISKWATITPDFQFYINPALNKKSDYGSVSSLRLTVFF